MAFYNEHKEKILTFMHEEGFDQRVGSVQVIIETHDITYNPGYDEKIRELIEIPFDDDTRLQVYEKFSARCIKFDSKRAKESEIFEDAGLCYETARTAIFGKTKKTDDGKRYVVQTNPSKEIVLRLGIALRLSEDELASFVKLFEKPFPRDIRDALIRYFIRHADYTSRLSWEYKYHAKGEIWRQLWTFLNDAKASGWNFKTLELDYDNQNDNPKRRNSSDR